MDNKNFKAFKIYIKVANALESAPVVAYYLKTYCVNKALEYLKMERAQGKDVTTEVNEVREWLKDLENLKVCLSSELSNKEQCKQTFMDFTFDMYQQSDIDYRNGNNTRRLAKQFLYVSVLFDAWDLVGVRNDDIKAKKNYANEARFKIMEAIEKEINSKKKSGTEKVQTDKLDPLAKLNFDLVDSIYVPQSAIDKFLNHNQPITNREDHQVLENLVVKLPGAVETKKSPVTAANNLNEAARRWVIPVGQSIRLTDEEARNLENLDVPKNDAPQNVNQNKTNLPTTPQEQTLNLKNGQGAQETPLPTLDKVNRQVSAPHIKTEEPPLKNQNITYSQRLNCRPNATNIPKPEQNVAEQNLPGYNQYQHQLTNDLQLLKEEVEEESCMSSKYVDRVITLQQAFGEVTKERTKSSKALPICKEAKNYCLEAASKLDSVKIKEAKEAMYKAIKLLEQIEMGNHE